MAAVSSAAPMIAHDLSEVRRKGLVEIARENGDDEQQVGARAHACARMRTNSHACYTHAHARVDRHARVRAQLRRLFGRAHAHTHASAHVRTHRVASRGRALLQRESSAVVFRR
jgi:hypothetical protein